MVARRGKKIEIAGSVICLYSLETNKEDEEEDSSDKQEEEEAREGEEGEEYYGLSLQLGCSCKGDLGVAHSK